MTKKQTVKMLREDVKKSQQAIEAFEQELMTNEVAQEIYTEAVSKDWNESPFVVKIQYLLESM